MEGCLNRGWDPILNNGCGGTGGVILGRSPGPPRVSLALLAPANQRSARGIGISTPCGAVSTQENSIFVPGVTQL